MPVQAKANGLQLSQVPNELSDLNALEMRLICLQVPFMKLVALPAGKQRSIHGPAVNVPSKVDTICNILSRLPSQIDLIALKLKRKGAYRGHYMYDFITPSKPLNALGFLKANNPLYANIEINEQWFYDALCNDEELCKCLLQQNDEHMETECDQPESASFNNDESTSSDVSEIAVNTESVSMECNSDSNSNDGLSVAIHSLKLLASQNGFSIHDVPYDGNCMFSAVSYQLRDNGVCNTNSKDLRLMVADYLEQNAASYWDFLAQPVASDDPYNADTEPPTAEDEYINSVADPQVRKHLKMQQYVRNLRQGAWGDNITIQAIADMLNMQINVMSSHHPMYAVTPSNSNAVCEIYYMMPQ